MRRINHSSRFIAQFENSDYMRYSFDDICYDDTKSATKIPASEYLAQGSYPIYDQATDSIIAGYSNDSNGVNMVFPAVLFGDHSRAVKYIDRAFYIGADGVKILRPINADLSTEFLYYQLKFKDVPNTGYNRHFKYLKLFSYCCPNAEEQRAFLAICHQADKSKFSDFKSRFIEECYSRYPKQKLGGHISVIRGVSYKPSDVRSSVDEGVAIILRSNNIADGEINFDDLVYVVQERVQNEQKLKPGDIVMCGSNGSIGLVGKAGLLKDNMPNTALGAFCLGIKCKETILPEYLNTYFNTQVYRNEIESMGNGTNIINIRPDNITNLSISIPPVEKQMAFVEVVNQADKSKYLN